MTFPSKTCARPKLLPVERPFLVELLKKHRGNISGAAAEARMTRKMIYRLASKFQIDVRQIP